MGIKDWFSRRAGGAPGEEEHEYKGYRIRPRPRSEHGRFYTAGVIVKTFPEGEREQPFIRADTHESREAAARHAVVKARQIIDERGDALFE